MPAEVALAQVSAPPVWEWVCLECNAESARYWHFENRKLAEWDAAEHNAETHGGDDGSALED